MTYRKRPQDGAIRKVYSLFLRPDTIERLDIWMKNFNHPNRAAAAEDILRRALRNIVLSPSSPTSTSSSEVGSGSATVAGKLLAG